MHSSASRIRTAVCSLVGFATLTVLVLAFYQNSLSTFVNRTLPTRTVVEPRPFSAPVHLNAVITVEAKGNFDERVRKFNDQLDIIRRQVLEQRGLGDWRDNVHAAPVKVLSGYRDDYLDELAANHPYVTTVVLPWLRASNDTVWSSLEDTINIPQKHYYEWTADDRLCTWIETPRVTKMKYDVIYNRTCTRNINTTSTRRTIRPVFFHGKPITRDRYWPNDGRSYPAHFYTEPPPFVFYVHILRDAVVTNTGEVYSRNLKLALNGCKASLDPRVPPVDQMHVFDEVFVIAQFWGLGVYHRMVEIVPRIVLFGQFLRRNPQIRIVAPEQPGQRLSELLHLIGVDDFALVVGPVRAKVVYLPRPSRCGFANVQESQALSGLYRDYIERTFPARPRNKLVLIRRSRSRRFTEQKQIEEVVERAAKDYNLTYTLFADNPTPSLSDTMMMFHSAVVVVGPHGAALSNLLFSRSGTYVVEGVCNRPHVNLCFLWLAHVLGHHWHGVASCGGCERVVDVAASSVDAAVRSLLQLWQLEESRSL